MQQATLMELLNHIVKLTEVVEKMSTNIVILNEKLDSNTKKVDRWVKRDVSATSLANGTGDDDGSGRRGLGVRPRSSTEPASARVEVVDTRDLADQDAAGSTESPSRMSPARMLPLYHNVPRGTGRPSTPRYQRRASIIPDALKDDPLTDSESASHACDYSVFEEFDDSHPATPPPKPTRLSETASAYGDTRRAPSRPNPEALSNTNIDSKSKPSSRSLFAEAFNNTRSHVKSKVKPKLTNAGASAVAPFAASTHTKARPKPRPITQPERITPSTIGSKHTQPTTQEAPKEKKRARTPSKAEDSFEPRREKAEKRRGDVTKAKGAAFNMGAPRKRQRMIHRLDSPNAK